MVQERTSEIAEAGNAVSVIRDLSGFRNSARRTSTAEWSALRLEARVRGLGRFRRSSACGPRRPRCAITTIRSFRISKPIIPTSFAPTSFSASSTSFVKAKGSAKELPQFTLLYLPDDHTGGTTPSKPTPRASVADNDLAVGRVVDAVSHSAYWTTPPSSYSKTTRRMGLTTSTRTDRSHSSSVNMPPRTPQPLVEHNFYTTVRRHSHDGIFARPSAHESVSTRTPR